MDFDKLAEKLGLDHDEYVELVELFTETSESDLASLENAIETQNPGDAEKAAHSLKGASASLGLTDIAEIARQIEKNAKENSIQDGTELIADIREKIQTIKHRIGG